MFYFSLKGKQNCLCIKKNNCFFLSVTSFFFILIHCSVKKKSFFVLLVTDLMIDAGLPVSLDKGDCEVSQGH